ncbi:tRNA threonylcarbamoyladenosine modificatiom protein TsaE [Candidatus Phytoplasma solani]|uniref:tRNA (adenosine(37)-N6)-threonylcarbamoyltransferase complex ATPase subunit type 1 TsaE n=1 Tax=Candidatus Phytoplasma solani TaxID=69896 RepID=UPI0032DAEBF5
MSSKKIISLTKITNSFSQTKKLGFWLGKHLSYQTDKTIILLQGSLGTGKTAFTKGFIKSFGIKQLVASPTFVMLKTYFGTKQKIYHLDLYRASLSIDFCEDLLEDFNNQDFLIVEFPEDCSNYFPHFNFLVKIDFLNEKQRKITIEQAKIS